MIYPKLFTKNSNGSINEWWCEVDGESYTVSYGQVDGKTVTTLPTKCFPKNTGKKNETTAEQQAVVEVLALYKKQRKQNYFDSIEDIDKAYLSPQLAKLFRDYGDKINWEEGSVVDEKLNGFCGIITAKGAFSRKNEQFHNVEHILEELKPFFEKNPNAYLHGEFFNPKYVNELNVIANLISVNRKPKDITDEMRAKSKEVVEYHIYDGYGFEDVNINSNTLSRKTGIHMFINNVVENTSNFNFIKTVNSIMVYSFEEMLTFAENYISNGGEGVIIRDKDAPYQHKRTKDLLKFKKMEDAEFEVISVEEGSGNWQGCAKMVWCKLPNGGRFKANIKGTQEHLREVYNNRDYYVGRRITVSYQELSPYGVPLIPYTDMVVRDVVEG